MYQVVNIPSQRVSFYMEFPEKLWQNEQQTHQSKWKTNTPDTRWGKVSHKLHSLHGRACFSPDSSTDTKIWQVVVASGRAAQFKSTGPSEKWWRGFKKCHYSNHFETLGKLLEKNDLLNKPEHIFNVDESRMSMKCKNDKLVVKKGAKQAHWTAKGQGDHITVNC